MALKFGTSGVRGLVTEFTDSEVYLFTLAFLRYAESLGQKSSVALAHDLRESSPRIQSAAIQAIHDFGRDSIVCGEIPTPALAYFAQKHQCLAIMITGSHIPADRNGMKFYLETGETLKADDQAIYANYEALKKESFSIKPSSQKTANNAEASAKDSYIRRYVEFFPKNILSSLKLLFYQHSSVAREIYPQILEALGANVVLVGYSSTFIPVDTEAIDAVDQFRDWIRDHNADALVSTDGDADRPLVVDGSGNVIPGDKIGALASLYLGCEAIALPISCNSGIAKMPQFKNITLTKIGSPFVVQALNDLSKMNAKVGGFEANGGYLLQSNVQEADRKISALPTRDAVLPVVSLLALAKKHNVSVNKVTDLLPKVFTASGLLKEFPTEQSLRVLENATMNPAKFFSDLLPNEKLTLLETNTFDGVRCSFENDVIIHLRPSGNAPEFRCYTEAPTLEKAEQLCKKALSALR